MAKIKPIFKKGGTGYSPISVIHASQKNLRRLLCNKPFMHLAEHIMLFTEQFGFRAGHSTDHVIIGIVNERMVSWKTSILLVY